MASNETTLTQSATDDQSQLTQRESSINVGETERWASAIGGGALALVGGSLLYRGVTGHCNMYAAAGISTAEKSRRNPNVSVSGSRGIRVEKSLTVNRSPEELFRFWRNFENLPRFMNHLESVKNLGENRSHWVAKAPAGTTVEWDAEVYNEKENELIAWRSLEGADVDNAGSVRFKEAPGGRGTEVKVVLEYDPPGGIVGAAIAKLFGEAPDQQIDEDLRRFKQVMEAGEQATTEGQPSGRVASSGK